MASNLSRVTDFVPATPILSGEVDAEFNQLVNLLNGTSSNVKGTIEVSDSGDPPLELNQLSTGPILKGFQAGIEKFRVRNDGGIWAPSIRDTSDNEQLILVATPSAVNEFTMTNAATAGRPKLSATGGDPDIGIDIIPKGTGVVKIQAAAPAAAADAANKKYVDDRLVPFMVTFKIDDPSTIPINDNVALPFARVPAIVGGFLSKIHIMYQSGSHTSGGSVTFKVQFFGLGFLGSGVSLDNTNNAIFTAYSEDFADQGIVEGNMFCVSVTARSGTVSERNVSINVEGYRKVS